MRQLKLYGEVRDGLLHLDNKDFAVRQIATLKDGEYTLQIQPYKNIRSGRQNRYYWGVIVELVFEGLQDLGFDAVKTKDDAHAVLKGLFFKDKIWSDDFGELEIVLSTRNCTTQIFEEKMEEIRQWASLFLSVNIPLPNTQSKMVFN